jgi:RNA polymerase sigma-B factor
VRARLIEKHMGLVRSVARRYARGDEPVDDLVQVGAIGLIKAVDRFEPARGRSLRAVAVPAIEGEIRHHLRDRSQLVRTPRPVVELAGRVRRAQVTIGAREGRLPTPAELAEAVGATEEQVVQALQSRAPVVELEPEQAPAAPDDFADERALLEAGMSVLSQRERRILELRYYEDRSQVDIAKEIGLSQAQVSRLIRRAVDRMRAAVVEDGDEAYPREEMATREVEETQPQQQSTHSGRLLVRMPQSLHAELARVAEHEGVSLNTLITGALASAVGWRDGAVDGLPVVDAGADHDRSAATPRPRWTSIALAANLVVVVLAAVVAIVLLIVALGHGW